MHRQTTFKEDRTNLKERLENIYQQRHPISILLDNLQDERNIASIYRLADAARLEKIYLYNTTTENLNQKRIHRIAGSTHQYISIEKLTDLQQIISLQQSHHFTALEITSGSIPYYSYIPPKEKILIIVGNEQHGISEKILELTKDAIHIPMYGMNTSMNVAMATAIVSYHLINLSISSAS